MKTIREQFEEIYPVPHGVEWSEINGSYGMSAQGVNLETLNAACDHDSRLDVFTRCQESQAIVTSLNDELVEALNGLLKHVREPESESEFQWPDHFKKQKDAFLRAREAVAKAKGLQS